MFDTPDKENAFFLAGMPIEMRDSHADYPALVLGNYILGHGAGLAAVRPHPRPRGLELRRRLGLQRVAAQSTARAFTVNAISAPQNAARSRRRSATSSRRCCATATPRKSSPPAKVSWAQGRQVARTQDGGFAGTLGLWTHVGRTMAWDAEFEAHVRALTADEVRDAMRRHLDLDKMTFMKGGDFAASAN